jgi:hypothetical protein
MDKQTNIISKDALVNFLNAFDSDLGLSVVKRTNELATANVNVVLHDEHEGLAGTEKLFNTLSIEDDTDWSNADEVLQTISDLKADTYALLPLGELYIDEFGEEISVEGDNALGYATSEQAITTDVYDFMGFSSDGLGLIIKPTEADNEFEIEFVLLDESSTALELSEKQDAELKPFYDIITARPDSDSEDDLDEANWDNDADGEMLDFGTDEPAEQSEVKAEQTASTISDDMLNDFSFDDDTFTLDETSTKTSGSDSNEELFDEEELEEELFDDDEDSEDEFDDSDDEDSEDDFDDMFSDEDEEE